MKPGEVKEGRGHGFLRANGCRSGCLVAITTTHNGLRRGRRTAQPGPRSPWSEETTAHVPNRVTVANDAARHTPPIICLGLSLGNMMNSSSSLKRENKSVEMAPCLGRGRRPTVEPCFGGISSF